MLHVFKLILENRIVGSGNKSIDLIFIKSFFVKLILFIIGGCPLIFVISSPVFPTLYV